MIGQQGLRRRAVTRVPRTPPTNIALLIAQMVGQLGASRRLNQTTKQLLQQPVRTNKILRSLIISQQLIQQLPGIPSKCGDFHYEE